MYVWVWFFILSCYVMIKIVHNSSLTHTQFKGSPDKNTVLHRADQFKNFFWLHLTYFSAMDQGWFSFSDKVGIQKFYILSFYLSVCVCLVGGIKTNIDCFPEACKLQTSLKYWRNKNYISRAMPFSSVLMVTPSSLLQQSGLVVCFHFGILLLVPERQLRTTILNQQKNKNFQVSASVCSTTTF